MNLEEERRNSTTIENSLLTSSGDEEIPNDLEGQKFEEVETDKEDPTSDLSSSPEPLKKSTDFTRNSRCPLLLHYRGILLAILASISLSLTSFFTKVLIRECKQFLYE
jgi:hypothetical protein